MTNVVIFNEDSVCPWQADENTRVMVTHRKGKDVNIFCRAYDVKLGDNVWEHNIVKSMTLVEKMIDGIKVHYGPIHNSED